MVFSNSRPKPFWKQRSKHAKLQCDWHRLHLLLGRLHVPTHRWHFQERYLLRYLTQNLSRLLFTLFFFRIFVASHQRWAALRRSCWDSFGVTSFIEIFKNLKIFSVERYQKPENSFPGWWKRTIFPGRSLWKHHRQDAKHFLKILSETLTPAVNLS